jgi:hypothetical protein
VAKAEFVIAEVPSFEFARLHGESNLNTWRDGGRVLGALAVERVNGRGRGRERPGGLPRRWVTSPGAPVAPSPREALDASIGRTGSPTRQNV